MTNVLAASSITSTASPEPAWVAIEEGVIVERGTGRPPRGARDLGDAVLSPGFIDLQANGVRDVDFATADPGAWARAGAVLLRHGVTVTAPRSTQAGRKSDRAMISRWISDRTELLHPADAPWVETLLAAHPRLVRLVTLAPEADPDLVATRDLVAAGVVVALGHSLATYEEAHAATDAGARVVTHLFNGMGPLHHRAPGLAGAALDDRLTPTLIADLVHVHPALVRLVLNAKRDVVLVSDVVAVDDVGSTTTGAARRDDGVLVGATTLLDGAVQNVVGLGVTLDRALELVTRLPARVLGLHDHGHLEPGARADIVAVDPATGAVRSVWRAGVEMEPR